jgi:hypothetical protein
MNKPDIEFTKAWWLRTINDQAKFVSWLQKLQRTELGGYTDHIDYMAKNSLSEREKLILTNIAMDELNHSNMFIDLMNDRKIPVDPTGVQSTYWDELLAVSTNFNEYCAANYFGEALAAYRFEIILDMPETPSDIREVISRALPDEIFHRETLMRLSGEEALAKLKVVHDAALLKLTGKKLNDYSKN